MKDSILQRWWPVCVATSAAALTIAVALRFQWKLDDAYITFSYAQNWVQGNGLVFNVGERVEGYTCFLWVALSALGLYLGADIVWWSTTLGILSATGAVFAAGSLARELAPVRLRPATALSAVMVGAYPPLAWWAASGMETALFTCLLTTAMWLHVRNGEASVMAPICLALASMTRPEGLLLSVLLCLDAVRIGTWRNAARYCAVLLLIFGPYYGWRLSYYGDFLPNTFYAKVGSTGDQVRRGIAYLGLFLSTRAAQLLLVGAAVAALSGVLRRGAAISAFLVIYLGYVIVVGGDVFPLYRFFIPVIPPLVALSVAGLLQWAERLSPGRASVGYTACILFAMTFLLTCVPLFAAQKRDLGVTRYLNSLGQAVCPLVQAQTGPDDAIASIAIGQLKYCTGRRVIDIVGLTDTHIAHRQVANVGKGPAGHERYDSEYVLAQRPKYIFLPTQDGESEALIEPLRDLWRQSALQRDYIAEHVPATAYYRRIDAPPLLPADP